MLMGSGYYQPHSLCCEDDASVNKRWILGIKTYIHAYKTVHQFGKNLSSPHPGDIWVIWGVAVTQAASLPLPLGSSARTNEWNDYKAYSSVVQPVFAEPYEQISTKLTCPYWNCIRCPENKQ